MLGLHNKPVGCGAAEAYASGPGCEEEEEERPEAFFLQQPSSAESEGKLRSLSLRRCLGFILFFFFVFVFVFCYCSAVPAVSSALTQRLSGLKLAQKV
jgi:hypothetical protein